jgi:cystathionine beta-lyase/cystathionine gamma-synthase/cytidine deaminase
MMLIPEQQIFLSIENFLIIFLHLSFYYILRACLSRWSIHSTFINLSSSPSIITQHLLPSTRLVWLESPSNPSLRLVDINQISSIVHAHDSSIVIVVDNTFASPLNQSPLLLGADICLSSLTKYINGHTDVIGGSLSMNRKDLYDKFLSSQSLFHMNLSPFDCYLVRRGLNTLALRMRQHMKNAYHVAQFLERHPAIERVFYPALPSHPQHEIYKKQGGASGMCSYILVEKADVQQFLIELKLCTVAVSLGGCETLLESPALMTHRSTLYAIETSEPMTDKLIRMSVGLENARDIINDLDRALNRSINQHTTNNNEIDYDDLELIEEAKRVSRRLHQPRLHAVAAALRTTSGHIYSGIHFESSQAFATVCGEVSAISTMVNDGHRDLLTIVALRGFDDDKNRFEIMSPCGRCRELIGDFNPNAQVILGTIDKPYRMTISDLMPLKSSLTINEND